jgi:hypothetical protein
MDKFRRLLPEQDPDCCRRVQKVEAEGEEGTLAAVAEGSAMYHNTHAVRTYSLNKRGEFNM